MIDQAYFMKILKDAGVEFFTGVPDSHLNGFCNYLLNNVAEDKHVIAAMLSALQQVITTLPGRYRWSICKTQVWAM